MLCSLPTPSLELSAKGPNVTACTSTPMHSFFLQHSRCQCVVYAQMPPCPDAATRHASPLPQKSSVGAASATKPARATTGPRPEPPAVACTSRAGGRTAALERAFAPEYEARVVALQKEEQRKKVDVLQMRLLRN